MGKADFKKVNDKWYTYEDSDKKIDDLLLAEEMPRSKKKKKKSAKKADHAHKYERVLVYNSKYPAIYDLYERCSICGKMHLVRWVFRSKLHEEEYRNLPILNADKDNVEYEAFPFA